MSKISEYLSALTVMRVTRTDVFLLASNIVIGSLYDIDCSAGYWTLLTNTLVIGIAYILLSFSLAEMTSALPFSGGIYGIARAFLHPFVGFYVCIFEIMINLFYIALAVRALWMLFVRASVVPDNSSQLLFYLLVYFVVLVLCLLGGKVFWWTNGVLGMACLILSIIYILGAIPSADFSSWKHAEGPVTLKDIVVSLPSPSLTYLGIQYLPLNSKFTQDPKNDVPQVMVVTVLIIFALSLGMITVAYSQSPGYDELATADYPFVYGFAKIFSINHSHALFLGIPYLFSTYFTFFYCLGKQASSMASSGLLPKLLALELPILKTPYIALICVTVICFVLNIFLYYYEEELWLRYAFICALSTYIVFICFFVAYIEFARNYTSLQRSVRSPFGVGGAVVGVLIFLLCGISVVGFQAEGYVELVFLVLVSLMVIGVYVWVLGAQEFSEEEKNELFKAYLITANRESKNRILRRNRQRTGHKSKNNSSNPTASNGNRVFAAPSPDEGGSSKIQEENGNFEEEDDVKRCVDCESAIAEVVTRVASTVKRSSSKGPSSYRTASTNSWSLSLKRSFHINKVLPEVNIPEEQSQSSPER